MMLLRIDLGFKNIGKSEKGSSISVDMGATGETVSKSKKDHLENLMKLPGVGKATAQKLYDSGIKSPAGVNKAGKKGLADAGISAAISKKLLAAVAKTAAKKTTAKAKSAAKKTTAKAKSTAKKATSKAVAAGTKVAEKTIEKTSKSSPKPAKQTKSTDGRKGKTLKAPTLADILKRVRQN